MRTLASLVDLREHRMDGRREIPFQPKLGRHRVAQLYGQLHMSSPPTRTGVCERSLIRILFGAFSRAKSLRMKAMTMIEPQEHEGGNIA